MTEEVRRRLASNEDYERARASPRRFIVLAGHELPSGELVIERHGHDVVVEKTGAAGVEAQRLDSRS